MDEQWQPVINKSNDKTFEKSTNKSFFIQKIYISVHQDNTKAMTTVSFFDYSRILHLFKETDI